MKRFFCLPLLSLVVIFICLLAYSGTKDCFIENNVEALSEGEGHFLYDCQVYSPFGGQSSTGFVCAESTTESQLFPCLSFGAGSTTKKCYK